MAAVGAERWRKIHEAFVRLGPDPERNIRRLTALCGELLGATCALYSRVQGDRIETIARWRAPADFVPVDRAQGHVCAEVARRNRRRTLVLRGLQKSRWSRTDPNVAKYGLKTYAGHAVRRGGSAVGTLCAVYVADVRPTDEDRRVLGTLAAAIGLEEERAAAADSLRRSESQLRQSQKMEVVGKLISSVAHELNNPLAAVVGYAQLLKAKASSKPMRAALGQIHRNAARCRRIMDNLLSFVRHTRPRRASVSPRRVVSQTLELFRYRLGTAHRVEVRVRVPAGLRVWADPQQLEQVAVNLIANACEAMTDRDAPRELSIRAEARGRRVALSFEDTGPGVAKDLRERVFEPFFTTKPEGGGTGLGLAISRQIAREHGGELSCQTARGGGASFLLEWPAASSAQARPRKGAARPRKARGLRALVVDDEPSVRLMIAEALRSDGSSVETAGSVAEAKRKLAGAAFDLVLADAALGDGTGLELFDAAPARRPPFLFVTGNVLKPALAAEIRRRGARCLAKPFDLAELRAAIHGAARRVAGRSA